MNDITGSTKGYTLLHQGTELQHCTKASKGKAVAPPSCIMWCSVYSGVWPSGRTNESRLTLLWRWQVRGCTVCYCYVGPNWELLPWHLVTLLKSSVGCTSKYDLLKLTNQIWTSNSLNLIDQQYHQMIIRTTECIITWFMTSFYITVLTVFMSPTQQQLIKQLYSIMR